MACLHMCMHFFYDVTMMWENQVIWSYQKNQAMYEQRPKQVKTHEASQSQQLQNLTCGPSS